MKKLKLSDDEFKERLNSLNKGFYTDDIYQGMNIKMIFNCSNGHKWNALPSNILKGRNCPICSKSNKVYKGYNDMWTTAPEQAKMLKDPEDGYKYTKCSGEKVKWLCPNCKNEILQTISNVNKRGLVCPICCEGISFPNRFMASLLFELNENFVAEYSIKPKKYRYDFYLKNSNTIIEMNSRQHYKGWNFKGKETMSLDDIQQNDYNKKMYAIDNKISNYIIINCSSGYYQDIIREIKKSYLSIIFNLENIKWDIVLKNAINSNISKTIEMYKKGMDTTHISESLKISRCTINRWLMQADNMNLCNYIKNIGTKYDKKSIILLNNKKVFSSISEAAKYIGVSAQGISKCCRRKSYFAGKYNDMPAVWRYIDEYSENEIIDYEYIKYKIASHSKNFTNNFVS